MAADWSTYLPFPVTVKFLPKDGKYIVQINDLIIDDIPPQDDLIQASMALHNWMKEPVNY